MLMSVNHVYPIMQDTAGKSGAGGQSVSSSFFFLFIIYLFAPQAIPVELPDSVRTDL
jgi:hypothetical protein